MISKNYNMIKYKIFLLVFLVQFYSHSQKANTIKEIPAVNFQTQVDGKTTNLYTLKNKNGMTAQITNYGARVVSLWVPDRKGDFQDVVWGFETIAEYLASSDIYCGPIVGAANIQIATCSPNFLILESIETWGGFHTEILKSPIRFEEGHVIPSTAPGLGVELNEDVARANPYTGDMLHLEMTQHPVQ